MEANDTRQARLVLASQVASVVVPIVLWFAPLGLEPRMQHALAIACFMILAWILQAFDYSLTGLIGCFCFWAFGVVDFEEAFAGFSSDTTWFIFSALVLGAIATRSRVSQRLAHLVMMRMGTTYPRILLGLIVTDFLLTFIVPSGTARVVIVATIALGLMDAMRLARGSNVGRGMFLVLTYTATIFDKMIIAGAASLTARGLIERIGGVEVLWSQWFLAFLPSSVVTVIAAWRLVLWLYPPENVAVEDGRDYLQSEARKAGPWTWREIRGALLLTAAVALWLTDFLHPIPAAGVAIGVALIALLPGVGVLPQRDLQDIHYMPVVFVATAISLGTVLESTRALEVITDTLFSSIESRLTHMSIMATTVLYWAAFIYHFFLASEISMLATSIPVVMAFAKEHALSPLVMGMIWTFAAGGKLFVYQNGVLLLGYSYGYFHAKDVLRFGAWLTVLEFVVLLFLVTFWWPAIGVR